MFKPPHPQTHFHPQYRADIDGLRAFAVMAVALYHFFPFLFAGGFIGVDVFFVISGYLISGIVFRELDSKQFSFRYFYRRRILRLFPALAVVLIVTFIVGSGVMVSDEFAALGKHVAASIVFIQNLNLWSETGYFDVSSEFKPLLHLWSLGVEEQFYLLWPAFLLLAFKLKLNRTGYLAVLTVLSLILNLYLAFTYPFADFYFPFSRFWELFVGAWIFHLESRRLDLKFGKFNSEVYSAIGLLIITVTTFLNFLNPYPGFWSILPVLAAFCIIGPGKGSRINKFLFSNHWVVLIGLISYPLYLWHWSILVLAKYSIPKLSTFTYPNELIKLILLGVSIVAAYLTYRFIEKPVRYDFKIKRPVLGLSLVMLILFSFGIWTWQAQGFPNRDPEAFRQIQGMRFFWKSQSSNYAKRCKIQYKQHHSYCFQYIKDEPPSALLIGDSLANQYFPSLAKYLDEKHDLNLLILAREQVPALYGTTMKTTLETNDESFEKALNDPNIKLVVLSQTLYGTGQFFDNRSPLKQKPDIKLEDALARTFETLLAAKKEVVFFLPNPYLNFNHKLCIPRPLKWIPIDETCAISAPLANYLEGTYRNQVLSVTRRFPDVKVFDPYKYFCDEEYCYAKRNNKILYSFDGAHLSVDGAYWIGQYFDF